MAKGDRSGIKARRPVAASAARQADAVRKVAKAQRARATGRRPSARDDTLEEPNAPAGVTAAVQAKRAAETAVAAAQAMVADLKGKAPKARAALAGRTRGEAGGLSDCDAEHVDLVKNEWLAGYQVVVARVSAGPAGLMVDTSDPSWEQVVRRADDIDPDAEPQAFLGQLSDRIHGSYLFATEPHAESACPYHDLVVRMQSIGESTAHPQAV